ncbi:MAG: DUF5655 domain-containing protein [Chloroflexota bacterium]
MPLTPEAMRAAVAANLPAKTGKDLATWAELLRAQDLTSFKARVEWLKREHGLGHVQAQVVAWEIDRPLAAPPPSAEVLLAAQYAGEKAALLPIYERLVAAARALGDDVRLEERQTYMTLVRRRQFGLIQPTSRQRVTLGLKLPGAVETPRLRPAGSFGSGQVTHRVDLTSVEEVDDEVRVWLSQAYAAKR